MQELKYTTIEDIKEFLKTLDYTWDGKKSIAEKEQPAKIEDFQYNVCLIVKNNKTNEYKLLRVAATDDYFHIVKDNPKMKYDIINHSLAWQVFMINRKPEDYAQFIYKKAKEEKQKLEKVYDNDINLLKKRAEFLAYQKSLKIASFNTTILNAEHKLNKNNKQNNKNLENDSLNI